MKVKKIKKRQTRYLSQPKKGRADWVLVGLVLGLTIFGLLMIANSSVVEAYQKYGDRLYFFKLQLKWAVFGLFSFLLASFMPFNFWKKIALPFLFLSILALVLVLIPGLGERIWGARRWLVVGPVIFQPAELVKLAFVVYLASFLEKKTPLLPFIFMLGLVSFLVMLEPDLGTTIVIVLSAFLVYFVSGGPILGITLMGVLGLFASAILIFSSDYRRLRLLTFLNPTRDPLGASYHIRQILIALGSGGLTGVGLGQSRQKYEYLPAVMTDSIFAVVAEELGFLGGLALLVILVFFVWRGFRIARETPDRFGQLLATGIIVWIGIQTLVNLSSMVALLPLTGVPLPFISYGGSSLILVMTASGILVNISKFKS